jgi:hypothetical protein
VSEVAATVRSDLKASWSLLLILLGFYAPAEFGNLVEQFRRSPSGYILVTETPRQ